MSWWNKFKHFLNGTSEEDFETVRAKDSKGRYIADNPDTKKNEAYTKRKKMKMKANATKSN